MTDKEIKKLVEQGRVAVGSNAVVLAALINAKATEKATSTIGKKLDAIIEILDHYTQF